MVRVTDLCPIPRGRGSRIVGQSFGLVAAESGVFLLSRAAFMLSLSPRLRVRNGVRQMSGARVTVLFGGTTKVSKAFVKPDSLPERVA